MSIRNLPTKTAKRKRHATAVKVIAEKAKKKVPKKKVSAAQVSRLISRAKAAKKKSKKAAQKKKAPKSKDSDFTIIKKKRKKGGKRKSLKKVAQSFDLFKSCCCLEVNLTLGRQTQKSKDARVSVAGSTKVDQDQFNVSQKLISCPEFDAIKNFDYTIHKLCRDSQLPLLDPEEVSVKQLNDPKFTGRGVFRSGVYLIPIARFAEASGKLVSMEKERNRLVQDYIAVYPQRVKEQKKRLGFAYDASKYVTNPAVLVRDITMTVGIYERLIGKNLMSLDEALARKEKQKQIAEGKSAARSISNGLRIVALRAVRRFTNILKLKLSGKSTHLNDSNAQNLFEIVRTFHQMNVVDDSACEAEIKKLERITKGYKDADLFTNRLKNDDDFMREVYDAMSPVGENLEDMIQVVEDHSRDVDF